MVTLDQLYQRADFITAHAPLTATRKSLVGAAAFAHDEARRADHQLRARRNRRRGRARRGARVGQGRRARRSTCSSKSRRRKTIRCFKLRQRDRDAPSGRGDRRGANSGRDRYRATDRRISASMARSAIRSTSPRFRPRNSKSLGPHLRLAERLGRLAAQLIAEPPVQVTVGLGGEAAGLKAEPITAAALKGLLSGFLDQDFNYVSAPFIARERGIGVTESRSRETTDYINTLTLSVRTPSGTHEVAGAADRQPRSQAHPNRRLPGRGGARGLLPDAPQPRRAGRGRRGGLDARAGGNQYRGPRTGTRPRRAGWRSAWSRSTARSRPRCSSDLKTIPAITSAALLKL